MWITKVGRMGINLRELEQLFKLASWRKTSWVGMKNRIEKVD